MLQPAAEAAGLDAAAGRTGIQGSNNCTECACRAALGTHPLRVCTRFDGRQAVYSTCDTSTNSPALVLPRQGELSRTLQHAYLYTVQTHHAAFKAPSLLPCHIHLQTSSFVMLSQLAQQTFTPILHGSTKIIPNRETLEARSASHTPQTLTMLRATFLCTGRTFRTCKLSGQLGERKVILGGRKLRTSTMTQAAGGSSRSPSETKQLVDRMHALLDGQPLQAGWDKLWMVNVVPWDLGKVTPVVASLVREGKLPEGRALVPGCGAGHDVVALAGPARHVVGLDISDKAVAIARSLSAGVANSEFAEFIVHDFFTYAPAAPFDLIFDYTFFCAMEPPMRPAWAKKTAQLLAPDGLLVTLMYPIAEYAGGPPFAVSVEAYEQVLLPLGFKPVFSEENHLSVEARKGREILTFWKRSKSNI